MSPRSDDPPLSPSARKRLAERLGCAPEEVEERCRQNDDIAWIGAVQSAINSCVDIESTRMCAETRNGAKIGDQEIGERLLAAWALGRLLVTQEEDADDLIATLRQQVEGSSPPPLFKPDEPGQGVTPPPVVGANTVSFRIDTASLQEATMGEMTRIQEDIDRGLDVSPKEMRARLNKAVSEVKFALAWALIGCLGAVNLFAAAPEPWPQKGDTVFVSSRLTAALSLAADIEQSKQTESVVEACWPCTVKKVRDWGWSIVPRKHYAAILDGEGWPARFHRTAEECRTAFERDGQPLLLSTGPANRIQPSR